MRHALPLLAALLAFPDLCRADAPPTDPPKNIKAQEAIDAARRAVSAADVAHAKAVAAADAVRDKAVKEARQKEVAALKEAMAVAMKAQDVEDVKRIDAAIKAAQAEPLTFIIDAAKDWQPTVAVQAGQTVTVSASGGWSVGSDDKGQHWSGPEGETILGRPAGFLELRVGDAPGAPTPAGAGVKLRADHAGVIQLRQHDDGPRTDNAGQIRVTVTVQ